MTTILRAVRTCDACPSQWDAWTDTGHYLYLRYRCGIGTAQAQPSSDPNTWTRNEPVAEFGEPSLDGYISLTDFCAAAGLDLASDAEEAGDPPLYVIEL